MERVITGWEHLLNDIISSISGGRGRFHDNSNRARREERPRYRHTIERSRSRSPSARRYSDSRDSRERRHKDKVKEFLKNDR